MYVVVSLAGAAALLRINPARYAAYALWLWVLTPWLRRVVDLHGGRNPSNPIVLTPIVVTLLTLAPLLRRVPQFRRISLAPFALALAGIVCGVPVGIVRAGPAAVVYSFLLWLVPLSFGAWLSLEWLRYAKMRDAIVGTFSIACCAVGAYGVLQFVAPPAWDRVWMVASKMNSIGRPFPFEVRVFSLLNSPGTLGPFLSVGLLFLLASTPPGRTPAFVLGAAALLLAQVRSAWLGTVVGILIFTAGAPRRMLRLARHFALLVLAVLAVTVGLGVTAVPGGVAARASEVVSRRVQSITGLTADRSYYDRQLVLRRAAAEVLDNPLGLGLGSTGEGARLSTSTGIVAFDNGLLEVLWDLGWLGAAAFYGAVLWIALRRSTLAGRRQDLTALAARSALCSCAVQLLSGNQFVGAIGVVFWTAAGLLSAGQTLGRRNQRANAIGGL